MASEESVTDLLHAAGAGDEAAFRRVYALTYDELRRLAHVVRGARGGDTLNTTALVHAAYLTLAPGQRPSISDRPHFFRIAARAMRQVLVDAARRQSTRREGAVLLNAEPSAADPTDALSFDMLALDAALRDLEEISQRQARVVECRFFAGLSVEDTAAALAISEPTVKRDWRVARAWLARSLDSGPRTSP
jgi:RNA polymerase sigma factor (TIGR02999 family)